MCKLTEEQIEFARDMCLSGSTYYDACRELETQYGVVINPESLRYYAVRKHKPKESIINKLKGNGIEKVLILSDLHIPYHRDDVVDICASHKDEISMIIFNGDTLDCKSISKYIELGRGSLIDEMAVCHSILNEIDKLTPNARKVMVLGNHEQRLEKYMASRPNELNDLHSSNILREICDGFKKVDHESGTITYYNQLQNYEVLDDWYFEYNGMICCHPLSFSKIPARTAYNAVEYFVRNGFDFDTCLVAHTHHYGSCMNLGKYTVETGCLCKPQPYSASGKLTYIPQDCGYHLAVFKDGKYDVNESRNYIMHECMYNKDKLDFNNRKGN